MWPMGLLLIVSSSKISLFDVFPVTEDLGTCRGITGDVKCALTGMDVVEEEDKLTREGENMGDNLDVILTWFL